MESQGQFGTTSEYLQSKIGFFRAQKGKQEPPSSGLSPGWFVLQDFLEDSATGLLMTLAKEHLGLENSACRCGRHGIDSLQSRRDSSNHSNGCGN
jgi:hypothetical protein